MFANIIDKKYEAIPLLSSYTVMQCYVPVELQ